MDAQNVKRGNWSSQGTDYEPESEDPVEDEVSTLFSSDGDCRSAISSVLAMVRSMK